MDLGGLLVHWGRLVPAITGLGAESAGLDIMIAMICRIRVSVPIRLRGMSGVGVLGRNRYRRIFPGCTGHRYLQGKDEEKGWEEGARARRLHDRARFEH
jgi:hypothetical protein